MSEQSNRSFRALRFHSDDSQQPTKLEVSLDSEEDLLELRRRYGPIALVVELSTLRELRALSWSLVNRGRKDSRQGLRRHLLGLRQVPIIDGGYSVAGKLATGVGRLLHHAVASGEGNLYIIGAKRSVYKKLALQADDDGRVSSEGAASASNEEETVSEMTRGSLLQSLLEEDEEEVPTDLFERYVSGSSAGRLARVFAIKAARTEDPVLILGESGTGKELIARAIHENSSRRHGRFVPVNCAAIAASLFESELFGHKKGAYTDARTDEDGLWKAADRGTLFLDEIGDLHLDQQVKILRSLEESTIRAVGSATETKVEARVVAATNRDLLRMMSDGEFREDLYYRLRGFVIHTPPLREVPEDIPALAQFFWQRIAARNVSPLPPALCAELQSLPWPGNARQLRAVLMHLHALFGSDGLSLHQLRFVLEGDGPVGAGDRRESGADRAHRIRCARHLRRVEDALRACHVLFDSLNAAADPKAVFAHTRDPLGSRLLEIGQLCVAVELFDDPAIFLAVDQFRKRLGKWWLELSDESDPRLQQWKDSGHALLGEVLIRVSGRIDRQIEMGF